MDVTKNDDHQEDIDLLLKGNLIPKRGIIHIGAHEGQEVAKYLALGFKKIMLIEANSELVELLNDKFRNVSEVVVVFQAISDIEGTIDFHIHTSRSGSTEPASILKMKEFNKIVKTLSTPKTIQVPTCRLESLFKDQYELEDYNFINVDVQGAELHVFKGASSILPHFDAIISEVNLIELYEGAALEEEIVDYLEKHSFIKEKCIYHELYEGERHFKAWGECLFLNKGKANEMA
ncbi:MAG: hypothetical protein COW03_09310 [Cytophagales bacterium CG12_big_fil_rev_8_21_14_0_65_40_12]|nr:MAG: hypothetical protein COW03_09310 [Cytophagales bacterium CG12_big_fil_rev_8_21_14_0_65_40_12]PIW02788.1 MAG: hypothetical protein COW40_18210 [Cytophagales bacterium CG17_big_fil_post_rev_8_21_14_2_50_40_13]